MKKYESISLQLQTLITQQAFKIDDVFLSIREVADLYQVGINTAYQALQQLEDAGYLKAKHRVGYVVAMRPHTSSARVGAFSFSGIQELAQRATLIRQWAQAARQAHKRMDLATGDPAAYLNSLLQATVYKIIRSDPTVLTRYVAFDGLFELRQKMSGRYRQLGCDISPESILLTHGATQALSLALQATLNQGDWVLVESPTYFGFLQILESLKLNVVSMTIDPAKGIEPDYLLEVIEQSRAQGKIIKACLLQANFQNPTGCSIAPAVRSQILDVFHQHQIIVIEDDTFRELSHGSELEQTQPVQPLKAFDRYNNVILCGSLSKLIAPGFRVGFIHGAAAHEKIKTLFHATNIGCDELSQRVISHIYPKKFLAHLEQSKQIYRANMDAITQAIKTYFPKGTQVNPYAGGYLLWVILPTSIDTNALFDMALNAHSISFAPGSLFSTDVQHASALRINAAAFGSSFDLDDIRMLGELALSLLHV
jgi:DNA-binding transcriptional MocR family regulator